MRYFLPFVAALVCLSFATDSFAQKKEIRKAKSAYEDGDYFHCSDYFIQAQQLGAVLGIEEKKMLARSYYELNNMYAAMELYLDMESNLSDEDLFVYAQVLHRNALYEMAIEWYEKAKTSGVLPENMPRLAVNDLVESCRWALANENSSNHSFLANPNFTLASAGQSFGVQIFKDKVVFSSAPDGSKVKDKNGNPVLNLYSLDIKDYETVEGTMKPFSQNLMSPYHVGAISFTSDNKHMFFTKTVDVEDINRLKIFIADFDGKDWVNVRVVEFDSDEFDLAHPAVSPDDKYLYFVSNMPARTKMYGKTLGNYGGKDIYRAEFSSDFNHFKKVENLGDQVNTYGNEVYPVVNEDGNLYFSSDVRNGFGGLDVFVAEYIDGKWQNSRNMLKPFNSNVDDFCYVIFPGNPDRGFISTNRYGNLSSDVIFDVRKVEQTKPTEAEETLVFGSDGEMLDNSILDAQAVDEVAETKPDMPEPQTTTPAVEETQALETPVAPAVPATVLLATNVSSTFNNEIISGALVIFKDEETEAVIAKLTSDQSGKCSVELPADVLSGDKDVIVVVSKDGFNEKTVQSTASEVVALAKEGFKLTPIFNDQVLDDISGMSFAYNNDLDQAAMKTLDKLAAYLIQNSSIVIKLNAHTEAKGNRYGNLEISQKMADKAKDYLVSKGVNPDQLIPRGYGERYLLNRCHRGVYCDASKHKINRRVEVVVWNVAK